MEKNMYKIWVNFSEYSGNFKQQFIAFMFGVEDPECSSYYTKYLNECEKAGRPLEEFENMFLYTPQQVDDWTEETFFNISNYLEKEEECNAIFIQLNKEPSVKQFELFKKRTKEFCKFYNDTYEPGAKNLKAQRITVEHIKEIYNVLEDEIIA